MSSKPLKHGDLTDKIIGAFYKVYNRLGYGFLEKVYENALVLELRKQGLSVRQQSPIHVYYENELVGEYFADLIVDDKVIVELKAAEAIDEAHLAQLTNYLKATRQEVGLLLNFGMEPVFMRRIFDL
ncbi:MAG: GxxExxY protein [Caldilineaceae bacterium]|nr:GxxExxY protein [Caldilineaceae bacterium]MBP8107881.1 GxxExxY protein [Caldilineaceae bacterium]MBP8122646.1 GxxExxY protein [Caldilineaceae bacterium]MBP9071052.1 GxxExxY protein [Caldilineaceae bacterium]